MARYELYDLIGNYQKWERGTWRERPSADEEGESCLCLTEGVGAFSQALDKVKKVRRKGRFKFLRRSAGNRRYLAELDLYHAVEKVRDGLNDAKEDGLKLNNEDTEIAGMIVRTFGAWSTKWFKDRYEPPEQVQRITFSEKMKQLWRG